MQFSHYQTDFFDALRSGRSNIVLNAVAGSGKTTTLVEASRVISEPRSMVFLAFNKHIAAELQRRMPDVDCRTIHSLGYDACRRAGRSKSPQLSKNKGRVVFDTLMTDDWRRCGSQLKDVLGKREPNDFRYDVLRLSGLIRLTLTDPDDTREIGFIAGHYGVEDYEGLAIECAGECVRRGDKLWEESGLLDFDDMLWLPYRFGYSTRTYKTVLVDELQDLSAAQLYIAMSALGYQGRFVGVGDPHQAIQGFAGADADSFYSAMKMTGATEMPLSICYRCPQMHINMARQFVEQIEAAPDAEPGEVLEVGDGEFMDIYTPERGDLIVCRTNAPLVRNALRLIARGVQARVRGNDISEGLVKLVKRIGGYMRSDQPFTGEFSLALESAQDDAIIRLKGKPDSEGQIQRTRDQFECVRVIFESSKVNSLADLQVDIADLFADDSDAVWLSSIHRAKGLEAENVYILNPDKMEIQYPTQQDWQIQQERNVHYVGLTRSKRAMYMVRQ